MIGYVFFECMILEIVFYKVVDFVGVVLRVVGIGFERSVRLIVKLG